MIRTRVRMVLHAIAAFLRWMIAAAAVGALCGVVGALFAIAVEKATHLRAHHDWLLFLLPIGGLAIAGLYRLCRLSLSIGTDEIITTVRTQGKVSILMAPAIFISTVLTHLLGGSSGREGAALQLGGSIGAKIGDLTHPDLHHDSRRIFELCGMAAVFSALFGTPLTATLFVLEMVDVGTFNHRAFLPCIISAVTADLVAKAVGVPVEPFGLAAGLCNISAITVLQSGGLGICAALTSLLFCGCMHASGKYLKKWLPNNYVRIAAGGAAVVGLSLLLGTRDYNGGGMSVLFAALDGQALPAAFLLKIVFTAITLGSGFKGGEIVPSFFVGATMGCTAATLMNLSPAVGAGLGMIGVFCGVTNAPLASVMLSVELFGTEYLPLFGVVTGVAFMLSGNASLYHSQGFSMPKLGRED